MYKEMYEDCCFDLFEGFIEYLIELDDNNLIKMIINYYRDSPNKFLERICEHIVASGNEELYNYVIDIIPKVAARLWEMTNTNIE